MSLRWQTKAVIMYMCNDLKLFSDRSMKCSHGQQILSRTIYLLYLCSDCNLEREAVVSENCMHYSAHLAGWIPCSLSFHLTLPTLCPTSRPSLCLWQQKSSRGVHNFMERKGLVCRDTAFRATPALAQPPLLLVQLWPWRLFQSPFCSTGPKWCEDTGGVCDADHSAVWEIQGGL